MYQYMTHPSDLAPGDFRVLSLDCYRETIGSLADNLQVMNDPYLEHRFTLKSHPVSANLQFDFLDCFQNIEKPFPIASHNRMASLSTRSRIRERNPFSVTTST